jgi:hypothetical protein
MYFDDIYMKNAEPATRVSEYSARILEFCEEDPYLREEIEKERKRFFTSRLDNYYPTSEEKELAELRFADYFLFSYSSEHYKMTPLELFLSRESSDFNKKDREIYSGFKSHIYSAFEVLKVIVGSHFLAKDLSSDKVYKVRENKATYQMEEKNIIIARIVPYEEDYALFSITLLMPRAASYLTKREWRRMMAEDKKGPDPLMLERVFYHKKRETTGDNLEMVEKKLRRILKKHLGKRAPSIRQLKKRMNETTDPMDILRELTEKIPFSITKKLIEFQELFNAFWNLSSRDEFSGRSPQQKTEEMRGPRERELIHDLMRHISTTVKPDKFSSKKDLQKEIEKRKKRWLSEPQPELNYMSPWEVILRERKKLSSPIKDFGVTISVAPLIARQGEKINLDDITPEVTPLAKDLEVLLHYFEQNKVKATPKNKWIPFKHVKIIERDFQWKDGFIFLGKEEKRGEEPRKSYIYFIDKICRTEEFIYIDEKGKISVNRQRVKEFSQKSYGEKLFQLLCVWVEKIDWKELRMNDFLNYDCEMHQQQFETFLYHFHRFKTNEKITPGQLMNKLYGSRIKMIESEQGLKEHVVISLKKIILDYLKWLGIIKTEGEEIVEGMGIFSIKRFWITPYGRKLINRLIEYLIKKGRIKVSK